MLEIKPLNDLDPRLRINDKIGYALKRHPAQNSYIQYGANTDNNNNNIAFNIQLPSNNTIINREVLFESTIDVKINYNANIKMNDLEYNPSSSEAFSSFPLHQCIINGIISINGTQLPNNMMSELLPIILNNMTDEKMQLYQSGTPCYRDNYFNYEDALGNYSSNPLAGFGYFNSNKLIPRGAYPINTLAHVVATDQLVPFDSTSDDVIDYLIVSITVREPLLFEPFYAYSKDNDGAGLTGVMNINCNFIMTNNANRCYRVANAYFNGETFVYRSQKPTYTIDRYHDSKLIFNFCNVGSNDQFLNKCVVGMSRFDRYYTDIGSWAAGDQRTVESVNVQLSEIPQYLILFARPTNQTVNMPDAFLSAQSINLSFNNRVGLLSQATPVNLHRMSISNNSNQHYLEFAGNAGYFYQPSLSSTYAGLKQVSIPTCGSIIVLEFGTDIELGSDLLTVGSQGQFNVYIQINYKLNQSVNYPLAVENTPREAGVGINEATQFTLGMFCVCKGVLSLSDGSCEIGTALINKEIVNNTHQNMRFNEPIVGSNEDDIMVGRGKNKITKNKNIKF